MKNQSMLKWDFRTARRLARLTVCLASILVSGGIVRAQVFYDVEDLGVLPGDSGSVAWGINSGGDVAGWSNGPDGTRAFLYTDESGIVELPGLTEEATSLARDVNDSRVVVGQSAAAAVMWDSEGNIASLGSLGGESEALAVNSLGEAVGWSYTDGSFFNIHGFLFTPEEGLVDITPNAQPGFAQDINDLSQVGGYRNAEAFRWEDGTFLDLGVLPGDAFSYGFGINFFGDVAGASQSATGNSERIFLFTDAMGLQNLGGTGETNFGRRINNPGQVVGTGRPNGGLLRGVVFTEGLGLQALNDLITSPGQWFVTDATDINDVGVIAAIAFSNVFGETHAVRLTPTDDPGCQGNCLHSTITLSARAILRRVAVKARVAVEDQDGVPLSGATVQGRWTLPSGATEFVLEETDGLGLAQFSVSEGRGTYTFLIDDITLTGYTFDRANSELSESIEK